MLRVYIFENLPFSWFIHLQHRPRARNPGVITHSPTLGASCVQDPVPEMKNRPQPPHVKEEQAELLPRCKGKGHLRVTKVTQGTHCHLNQGPVWAGLLQPVLCP